MDKQNLNQESSSHFSPGRKRAKRNYRKIKPFLLIAGLLIIIAFGWSFFNSSSSVFNFAASGLGGIGGPKINSTDDRVNILLLGVGGEGHDGPYLTDSIIVASYNLKTNKATFISIPRDLWLQDPGIKINTLYASGIKKGDPLALAKDKIDNILGMPIHYGVLIDFSGFAKAIDLVEGVDINVEKTFDDYMYPIAGKENDLCSYKEETVTLTEEQIKQLNLPEGQKEYLPNVPKKVIKDSSGAIATDSAKLSFPCRYEHLHFDQGMTHMDGETALKYVRSRHALGSEGSDFARSRRQQLVIESFREKALSLETLSNPSKLASLISTFGKSIDTDIPGPTYLEFYNLSKKLEKTNSVVLGQIDGGRSLFINPPPSDYGGAWVLIPPKNDFTQVQQYLKDMLNETASPSPQVSNKPLSSPAKKQ